MIFKESHVYIFVSHVNGYKFENSKLPRRIYAAEYDHIRYPHLRYFAGYAIIYAANQ
jgi:hypothetical protein